MTRRVCRWPVMLAVGALLGVAGCGNEAPPSADQRKRAEAAGFDADLVYVIDVDGYPAAAGGSGVYGDAGYQGIYASSRGDDLRVTVERRSLDDGTCPTLPVPGAESVGTAPVQCTSDDDGWTRIAGDRREYAVIRGERLVRVSGVRAATTSALVRSATVDARPATGEELEALLPPAPEVVERGDVEGDNAPNNDVGAGG